MPGMLKDPGTLYTKVIISKGCGFNTPQARSICKIKVILDEMNQVLGLNEFRCKKIVVEDVDELIDIVIEDCVRTMKENEECFISIPHEYNSLPLFYNKNNRDENHKFYKIQFKLISFSKEPEIWEITSNEKLRRAQYHSEKGKKLYKVDLWEIAFRHFSLALRYLISFESENPLELKESVDTKELKFSCYLNLAACQVKRHNYESVVINVTKSLNLQSNNVKALYRRGVAYLELQEYEKAVEDLTSAHNLEPNNSAINHQLQILKLKVKKLNQHYANAFKKLFI